MADGRQTVAGAYARIDAHEDLCAERYGNIHRALADLSKVQAAERAESARYRQERRSEEQAERDKREAREREVRKILLGIVIAMVGWMAVQIYNDLRAPRPAAPAAVASAGQGGR